MKPTQSHVDVAIVGAGPAGMTAALVMSSLGLSALVIDEQQRPGGQIFRQPSGSYARPSTSPGYGWGQDLVEQVQSSPHIQWRLGSTVLGIFTEEASHKKIDLVVAGPNATETLSARSLLIATGAMDLPVAFPGWTLPGVVTAGAIQTMIKAQHLLLAKNVAMTGGHPLLLLVAGLLLDKGATIAGIATPQPSVPWGDLARAVPAFPERAAMLSHAVSTALQLHRSKVPLHRRAIVTAARGEGHVEEVDISLISSDGILSERPLRTVAADGVVLGYGFQPSTDLARQAGCALRWDSPGGGWVVKHDANFRTTVPNIFVAGEPTGVAGADQARLEGRLAALSIVAELGDGSAAPARHVRRTRRALRRATRFSTLVQRAFEPPRAALLGLTTADTIICRCEGATRANIEAVVNETPFLSTANALKLECRTGMGPCQGRYCELTATGLLAQGRGVAIDQVGHFSTRFPIRPATVSQLSKLDRPSG